MKSKYDLTLTRKQITSLNKEVDADHEMKFAKDCEYEEDMDAFLVELDMVDCAKDKKFTFQVGLNVADAIASSDYKLAPVFSAHYFKLIADNVRQMNKKKVLA